MTWDEVCANRYLRDLPFWIETNRRGQIVIGPPHNDHRYAQSSIYDLLREKMRRGRALQETVIDTEDGNKLADATWMSDAQEVWIRKQSGNMLFFDGNGPLERATLRSFHGGAISPCGPQRWVHLWPPSAVCSNS